MDMKARILKNKWKMRKKTVLIVVAHTDDETLGMAGTIYKHSQKGDRVYSISMTNGVGSRNMHEDIEIEIEKRIESALRASDILGFKWLGGGSFPDNEMDTVSMLSVTKKIEEAKATIKPDIVYTHNGADLNIDHRIVSQAVLTAFRPQPEETWEELRAFEIPSSTDYGHKSITGRFEPNLFIDITKSWKKKREALACYQQELRTQPHSRSYNGIEVLAKIRGAQSGLEYAEAFETIRSIER